MFGTVGRVKAELVIGTCGIQAPEPYGKVGVDGL